jgi:hypothetical protein
MRTNRAKSRCWYLAKPSAMFRGAEAAASVSWLQKRTSRATRVLLQSAYASSLSSLASCHAASSLKLGAPATTCAGATGRPRISSDNEPPQTDRGDESRATSAYHPPHHGASYCTPRTPAPRHPGTSAPRHPGTSVPRHPGTSAPRHFGTPALRHPGTSALRHPGTSAPRHLSMTATSPAAPSARGGGSQPGRRRPRPGPR